MQFFRFSCCFLEFPLNERQRGQREEGDKNLPLQDFRKVNNSEKMKIKSAFVHQCSFFSLVSLLTLSN
jgi:hypothetical protein